MTGRSARRLDVPGQLGGVGDTVDAQRPPEGAALARLREASRIGMQVRSPPRHPAGRIGNEAKIRPIADRDDPQKVCC
jgi:hypothetical protein